MGDKETRRERYSDGFALTKYTMPVVWQMAEVIPGGFFIYKENEARDLIYASRRVLEIYGCDNLDEFKELTGYTFPGMVHPDDFPKIQQSIDEQIDSEEGDSMDYVVYRIIRKDGKIRWVDDYGHYSYSPEYGDVYYVFINDITEKKEMQDAEVEFEKLSGKIDKLTAGVTDTMAHLYDKDRVESDLEDLHNSLEEIRSKFDKK